MRFTGTRTYAIPPAAIWRALHDPEILEQIIPNCTRIERQPGYQVEHDGDFALGFEVGRPNATTGAEPIIGWLEVDRQVHHRHLGINLTLNDALTLLRAEGTVALHAREHGQHTAVQYDLDVRLPGMRGIGWSAQAHEQAESIITRMLDAIPATVENVLVASAVDVAHASANGHPRILLENERGHVVLLPAAEVPTPTQSMLRRIMQAQRRRTERHQRAIVLWTLAGTLGIASAALIWQWGRRFINADE
jgi:hypothetical protein